MTGRQESTRSHTVENVLWKGIWTCLVRRSKWWRRDLVDRSRQHFVTLIEMNYAHPILRLWWEVSVGGLLVARHAVGKCVQSVDWKSWNQETTEALGVGGRIILKRSLNKWVLGQAWTGFIRHRMRTSGSHLWSHYGTFNFRRMLWISWQTERLLTSEVGLYSVKFRLDLYCFSIILHVNLKCITNPLCRFDYK